MPEIRALGVGAYRGVPVRLLDGTVHGTLCGLSTEPGRSPSTVQLETVRTIAALIGATLAQQHQHEQDRAAQAAPLVKRTPVAADGRVHPPACALRKDLTT